MCLKVVDHTGPNDQICINGLVGLIGPNGFVGFIGTNSLIGLIRLWVATII
jgi:hypothetical protein